MSALAPTNRIPRLDKYELLEELGHGGMATVYRARDTRLERDVAVKLIHKHLRDNAEVRGRFVAEAKAVAKLRHPGIVDVYDVSADDDDERYLVVELIRGTTLRRVLDEHGALPAEVAGSIVWQLCQAVEHAHAAGVIHRDIKPENVLIDLAIGSERPSRPREAGDGGHPRARVKLTDFGIAKVLDAQGVTSTGQILGSPAHMAPEQIEGGAIAPTTDVFALGVLLYECFVGHLPFQGSNPAQVLRRVLAGDFEPADAERPEVGGRWAAVVAKALALEPRDRYPSAERFGVAIGDELGATLGGDAAQCLEDFFAEPGPYRERLTESLVPKLISRGELARGRGDVQGAAADFNRALALRPADLAILKRVTSLTRERAWSRRAARLSALAVTALALGLGSFAVARLVRSRDDAARRVDASDIDVRIAQPAGSPGARASVESAGVAVPSESATSAPLAVAPPSASVLRATAEVPSTKVRRLVRLTAVPAGAKLRVDGAEVAWFGRTLELLPGPHVASGYMPDDNPCCTNTTMTLEVTAPPKDEPEEVQTFTIALGFRNAHVSLVGGPSNARASCDNGLVFGAGAASDVRMADIQRRTSCTFMPGNKRQTITLNAGVALAVPWPG